jgi:outer membrane lipoprotein carrier protein
VKQMPIRAILAAALVAAAAFAASPLAAQEIVTAAQYFGLVADRYSQINDYEAKISITTGKDVQKGDLSFKAPSFLRVDFTSPPDQVIDFDGETLTIYIPGYSVILLQSVADKPGAAGAALATREGLRMLKRSYSVTFESSPAPQALDGGAPGEQAVRLILARTSAAEGFRSIKLYVTPETKLIRRIEGITIAGDKLTFDFTGIKTNVGIPATRFVYDSPASANVYPNFLFNSTN